MVHTYVYVLFCILEQATDIGESILQFLKNVT